MNARNEQAIKKPVFNWLGLGATHDCRLHETPMKHHRRQMLGPTGLLALRIAPWHFFASVAALGTDAATDFAAHFAY